MSDKTGGPAFPFAVYVGGDAGIVSNDECDMGGMTLRDYFAAKAMQAEISKIGIRMHDETLFVDAKMAYKMADAMIKARNAN